MAAAAVEATEEISEFGIRDDENEEEHPGRDQWYIARFVADDAPDWNVGTYLRTDEAGPSYRTVVVEAEISREKVPLRNCYKHVGQRASVRVNSGANRELTVSSPPFTLSANQDALFKARGDISAGEIKIFKDVLSVPGEVHLLVGEKEAEEVFNLTEGDKVEIGPFVGAGMDLRPMQSIYMFPTLVIFAEGKGIAGARALIEAGSDAHGLDLEFRQDVRLYYRARNQDALLFKDLYETWESEHNCKVATGTRETFMDLFDEDDTLEYEPATTAALIFTGGDEDAEKEALEVCKEAEITVISKDSEQQKPTEYLAQQGGQI